ncbi:unnamed protein product, partial [Nesidiocoris tenuis]
MSTTSEQSLVRVVWNLSYGLPIVHSFPALEKASGHKNDRILSIVMVSDCWELPWGQDAVAWSDLEACLILTGLAIVLLPFFLFCCLVKVGNLANDGFKLGRNLSACGVEPEQSLAEGPGGCRSLWRHGCPTGPFLHLVIAFCLLLPNLLIQARLIQADFLPR